METIDIQLMRTIGTDELASLLGRARSTLYNQRALIAAGKLPADALPPAINIGGKQGEEVRYVLGTVKKWLEQREAATMQKLLAAQPEVKRPRGRPRKNADPVGRIGIAR